MNKGWPSERAADPPSWAKSVVVIPGLDGARGGVAAYGVELARRLPGGLATTCFVVPQPVERLPTDVDPSAIVETDRDAAVFAETLERSGAGRLLLHFVGYGYATNGCPEWLAEGLDTWKRRDSTRRLNIYYHELVTEEPWWTRTYWRQPRQRRVVGALVRRADRVATSCPYFGGKLRSDFGVDDARLAVVPVPATLAKSTAQDSASRKTAGLTALVFGLAGTRARTRQQHATLLRRLVRRGTMTRLILAGDQARADEADDLRRAGVEVVARPNLDETQLAVVAAEADFGLVWNWPPILTKSTVFANLCTLGLPAVIGVKGRDRHTGLPLEPAAVVCDGGAADIEEAIRALADPERRAELRRNGLRLAQTTLDWSAVAAKLRDHFQW